MPHPTSSGPVHATAQPSTVQFFRIVEQARMPQRADRSAGGTLPARAARFCDAVTLAAAFGWYVFPPMDFSLLWDGADIFWTYDAVDRWMPLSTVQFPNFSARFDAAAPEYLRGCSPPFLSTLAEPGAVQIWSGLLARTAPDWSLLVRAPANLPLPGGYVMYEGIVETDRWFGPLFTNIRLTRTDVPVRLRADFPLFQAQPLPRAVYDEAVMSAMSVVSGPMDLDATDWAAYHRTVIAPNEDPGRPFGQFAVSARRRRKACPYSASP